MGSEPPRDGRLLTEALEDEQEGVLRRFRRRLESWVRFARNPAQWSADRYRRMDKLFFAAVMKDTWREPEKGTDGEATVADGEPLE